MRVALGVTLLANGLAQRNLDGIGSYTRELMARMDARADTQLLPYRFGHGPLPSDLGSGVCAAGSFGAQSLLALTTGLPFPVMTAHLAGRVDLVHATDHLIPRLHGVPVVASLMDAIPLAHPEWVNYRFKALKNALWWRTARWARHVITISEHSRQQVSQWFHVPESRISVIPLGVDARWFETPSQDDLARVRAQHGLPPRYFLAIGTLQARKNVARLIAAHRALPLSLRHEIPLVVAGGAGKGQEAILAQLCDGDRGALRWLRYVPDADMLPLLHQATAMVFPSLHEGFGLPVLEAFAAGVPVVASNTTALPEVAGNAALLVNPLDVAALAEAMAHVAENNSAAQAMREAGLARARLFTWEHTAEMTRKVYADVLAAA